MRAWAKRTFSGLPALVADVARAMGHGAAATGVGGRCWRRGEHGQDHGKEQSQYKDLSFSFFLDSPGDCLHSQCADSRKGVQKPVAAGRTPNLKEYLPYPCWPALQPQLHSLRLGSKLEQGAAPGAHSWH